MDRIPSVAGQSTVPDLLKDRAVRKTVNEAVSFQEVFQGATAKTTPVKFSAHALQRLQMRKINLTADDLAKIDGAVAKAGNKGSRESLLVMHNMALVVSVKNRTVITAVDGPSMKDNVFTNIDSAIFL